MKKGDLSMGVIIGAAIALLILVIISVLIFRTGDGLIKGTACESIADGAYCEDSGYSCDDGFIPKGGDTSCGDEMKCCVPFGA